MKLIRYVSDTQEISSYNRASLNIIIRYFRIAKIVYRNALVDPIYIIIPAIYIPTFIIITKKIISSKRYRSNNAMCLNEIDRHDVFSRVVKDIINLASCLLRHQKWKSILRNAVLF